MALDSQAREFLDGLEAMGNPPMSAQTPEDARAGFLLLALARRSAGGNGEGVAPCRRRFPCVNESLNDSP